jgi:hypothetical protein
MRFLSLLLFLFFIVKFGYSQSMSVSIKIENVRAELAADNKLVITYDIVNPNNKEVIISLLLKRANNPKFEFKPKVVSGAVGKGKFFGPNKKIAWELSKEFPLGLEEKDYYFEVIADLIKLEPETTSENRENQKGGGNLIYWIAGGALVTGGAVAAVLLLSKKEEAVSSSFPSPPKLPQP